MKNQKKNKELLCKKCKERPRTSLYFCKICLDLHNEKTKELKRKYRKSKKCAYCGEKSITRRCPNCKIKYKKEVNNSLFIQSKKAKKGIYGGLKQIREIL